MPLMYHYTDRAGYNGIRATEDWYFKAAQPPARGHPFGAYFTTLPRETPNLAQRLRIPLIKTGFFFAFSDADDLAPLRGGRGKYVFYSPDDYRVVANRQQASGDTKS